MAMLTDHTSLNKSFARSSNSNRMFILYSSCWVLMETELTFWFHLLRNPVGFPRAELRNRIPRHHLAKWVPSGEGYIQQNWVPSLFTAILIEMKQLYVWTRYWKGKWDIGEGKLCYSICDTLKENLSYSPLLCRLVMMENFTNIRSWKLTWQQ